MENEEKIKFSFECFLSIKVNPESEALEQEWKFPTDYEGEDMQTIMQFCFPEEDTKRLKAKTRGGARLFGPKRSRETFMFALTANDGTKRYGYCRRYFSKKALPKAYCFISLMYFVFEKFLLLFNRHSFSLFEQALDIIETRSEVLLEATNFLTALHNEPPPIPGMGMNFSCMNRENTQLEYFTLQTGSDTTTDHISYNALFATVPMNNVIKLLVLELVETRIVLVSDHLNVLSDCINGLTSLLYPFSWQHVFIPILPKSLLGYLMAPMPLLIGILSSAWNQAIQDELVMDDLVVYDLDTNTFIMPPQGEELRFPLNSEALLRNMLSTKKPQILKEDKQKRTKKKHDQEKKILAAFNEHVKLSLQCFYQDLFKGYDKFFTNSADLKKELGSTKEFVFDSKAFINSKPETDRKLFNAIAATQLFFMYFSKLEDLYAKGTLESESELSVKLNAPTRTLANFSITKPMKCSNCSQDIQLDDPCVSFNTHFYHSRCLRCVRCRSLLEGTPHTTLHCQGECNYSPVKEGEQEMSISRPVLVSTSCKQTQSIAQAANIDLQSTETHPSHSRSEGSNTDDESCGEQSRMMAELTLSSPAVSTPSPASPKEALARTSSGDRYVPVNRPQGTGKVCKIPSSYKALTLRGKSATQRHPHTESAPPAVPQRPSGTSPSPPPRPQRTDMPVQQTSAEQRHSTPTRGACTDESAAGGYRRTAPRPQFAGGADAASAQSRPTRSAEQPVAAQADAGRNRAFTTARAAPSPSEHAARFAELRKKFSAMAETGESNAASHPAAPRRGLSWERRAAAEAPETPRKQITTDSMPARPTLRKQRSLVDPRERRLQARTIVLGEAPRAPARQVVFPAKPLPKLPPK